MLYLDFETRSKLDLKKVGAYVYAAHPSTEIICAGLAKDDGPVQVLLTHDEMVRWVLDASMICAHNAEFEREILRHVLGIDLPLEAFIDSASLAALHGLPRNLEQACEVLGLAHQKDAAGNRLMLKLSKTRRPSKDDDSEFWTPESRPEDFSRLYDYCAADVMAMRDLHLALPAMSPEEREVWLMTARMNSRGVQADLHAATKAQVLTSREEARLAARFREIVGCSPTSPKAAKALGMDSLDKVAVRRALKKANLTGAQREALLLRKKIAKTSTKKLTALQQRTSLDGRLRGSLVYCGAERTGRWSGRGVQLQNLPRGLGEKTDDAFNVLGQDALDLIYEGEVLDVVSGMIRGMLVGPFLVGDFSQVEARVLAWLARQQDLVETFRTGGDPYKEMASAVYRVPTSEVTKDQRFMGKQAVLGCGYGMGPDKFMQTLDDTYDVQVAPEFAERVVGAYRARFRQVPRLWSFLEDGFRTVLQRGSPRMRIGNLGIYMGLSQLGGVPAAYVELPSGRRLWYARPRLVPTEWKPEIRYFGRNQFKGGAWEEIKTYGGRITENVVQAVSRDLLAQAMLRLEDRGFRLVLTVHDEVVAEGSDLTGFKECLTVIPSWAEGLPLDAEVFKCFRYRK